MSIEDIIGKIWYVIFHIAIAVLLVLAIVLIYQWNLTPVPIKYYAFSEFSTTASIRVYIIKQDISHDLDPIVAVTTDPEVFARLSKEYNVILNGDPK